MRPPLDALAALSVLLLSALPAAVVATLDTTPAPLKPCTIHSPSTGSFIDLRPLQLTTTGTKSQAASNVSYRARGYDYPYNFTLNFCGPVVESVENVDGVARSRWANISAYYHDEAGTTYSLGQENHDLVFRGRKLLTNYTMGSPCPDLDEDGNPILATARHVAANTIITFACDTSPTLSGRPAVSFIGTPDHCTYIFEVRSRYACGGTTSSGEKGTLGPGAVFLVILGIALLVYAVGGVVYRRNVMHQRGLKQIPNYEVWSAIAAFVSDITIIFISSCTRSMPSIGRLFGGRRGGYHRVGSDDRAASTAATRRRVGGGGGRDPDAENRLIDSYDEEWDN
ncbi:hypothetical protein DV737_g5246, partial [Chaetothyriales sp. CBS 132003]